MKKRGRSDLAMEWFQRSIFSREKRAGVDGLSISYVSIASVLVESAKEQFNSLKQLINMVSYVR